MRTRLRSTVTLLFLTIAVLLAVPAVAALAQDTGTSPAPTIQSDKPYYAPGELVTLTGGGWQSGESVHINVNDDQGQTWSRDADVTADASGNISDSFNLPDWFVATFKVTATGASGTATTSFTDANVFAKTNGYGSIPFPMPFTVFNDTTCNFNGGSIIGGGVTLMSDASFSNVTWINDGQSIQLSAPPAPPGEPNKTFRSWTTTNGTGQQTRTLPTICVEGRTNGIQEWTVNYAGATSATTTTLERTTGSATSTYGDSLTFTATVTANGGNPNGVGTVDFKDGSVVICDDVPLSGNTATCSPSLNAGSYSLTAVYSGTSSGSPQFQASTSSALSQTVNKAATTTTVTCGAGPFIFNGSAHEPCSAKVSGPGGLDQPLPVTYTNNVDAGTATASASYTGNDNYNTSTGSKDFIIEKADATVDVQGYEGTYDGTAHGATGTAKGVGGADLSSLLDLGASFTNVPGGTANWTFAGNDNYKSANGTAQIVINKAPTTTTVTCGAGPFTYNGSAHEPCSAEVSGPGGLNLNPDVLYANNINAGTATASYTYDESANYKGSSDTKTFTIGKKELLVNAKDQSTVYGDENLPPTYELSGFVNNEDMDSAGITGAPECSISGSAGPNVGEYSDAIVCAPGTLSADNYSFAAGSKGKLTITSITYNFSGFRSPVDNPGSGATPVFNSAKAGQSIPVKFGLGGNQGLNIIAAGYPKVTSVNCVSSATVAPIEEYATSTANGGLIYEATADQYTYIWKTQSTYVNKCYKFDLQLTDGTSHVAYFKFLK